MRHRFTQNSRGFATNEDGATAIIYALVLLPLILIIGLAIDFSRIRSAQSHLQAAVDGATLSSAIDFADSASLAPGDRLTIAEETFEAIYVADIASALGGFETLSIDVDRAGDAGIRGTVSGRLDLAFGGFFGRESIDLGASSAAEASPPQDLEIILALDNTGSMFRNNRFNLMRSATKGFVDTILEAAVTPDQTYIGVVPWATTVNINTERPGGFDTGAGADRSVGADGTRFEPAPAFQDRLNVLLEPYGDDPYTQAAMDNDFLPVQWRGCVRAAAGERIVSNAGNVSRALTDAPVDSWHALLVRPELRSQNAPAGFTGDPNPAPSNFVIPAGEILACDQGNDTFLSNLHLDVGRNCRASGASVDFQAACVSDPNEFGYFNSGGEACPWQEDIFPWTTQHLISGPNQNCPTAMLGLSQDRGQLIDKLDAMYPVSGGTHVDVGLTWALRMLSPRREWTDFFGHDRPSEYNTEGVRKILVILTDGQNIAPLMEGYYGCADRGTRSNAGECETTDSIGDLSNRSLNNLMLDACTEIRDTYGVEIFSIAVDITATGPLGLLEQCAGDTERFFNISAGELESVFEAIAAQQLRLLE